MIRAVLWDFGGVLTTSPFEAFNRYEAEHGLPKDFIRRVNAASPETNAWARFESGQIGADEFDRAFEVEARALGHPISGREVVGLLGGELRPRMVEALKVCKSRYRVACLTNNVRPSVANEAHSASLDAMAPFREVMLLFDLVIESSKEGIRKPNPAFYRLACERLGIQPQEAIFLDDLGVNLKPARALGMTTIKVVTEAQAIADLERTLGIRMATS
jgi:putative hydrolase of the HAD superfamily